MPQEILKTQIGFNHYVIKVNSAGLTDEESLLAPEPAGNCLNWVLGHILAGRASILELLGSEGMLSEEQARPYRRGSDPLTESSRAMTIAEILRGLERTQEMILSGLDSLDDAGMARVIPESPFGRDEETVASLLAGLVFHESYHVGQTGLLRRLAGYEGAIK